MVVERLTDGKRIAQLLASEVEGGVGALSALAVVDADPEVTPSVDGAFGFRLVRRTASPRDSRSADVPRTPLDDGHDADDRADEGAETVEARAERLAEVYVHPDRARLELFAGHEAAVAAAEEGELRVRPNAARPPRTLVFVESGAEAKRAASVLEATVRTRRS